MFVGYLHKMNTRATKLTNGIQGHTPEVVFGVFGYAVGSKGAFAVNNKLQRRKEKGAQPDKRRYNCSRNETSVDSHNMPD